MDGGFSVKVGRVKLMHKYLYEGNLRIFVYICMKAISEETEQFSILRPVVVPPGISGAST